MFLCQSELRRAVDSVRKRSRICLHQAGWHFERLIWVLLGTKNPVKRCWKLFFILFFWQRKKIVSHRTRHKSNRLSAFTTLNECGWFACSQRAFVVSNQLQSACLHEAFAASSLALWILDTRRGGTVCQKASNSSWFEADAHKRQGELKQQIEFNVQLEAWICSRHKVMVVVWLCACAEHS